MPGKTSKTDTAPAQTKTTKTSKSTPTPAAAKSAAAASPAAAKPKAEKASASKKKEPVVVEAAAPTEEVAPAVVEASNVSTEFAGFMTKLQALGGLISTLKTEFRALEKKASRELKSATKAGKRKRKTGNRSPSGFVKPTLISDELASFLGKTKGTEMARTEVTREINAYIRANQLQDKTNGRRINADTKLSSLLKLNSGEELTYFNLQRYMSPHFAKSPAAAAAAAAAAATV
jgi:upstream activation factor subunit UAF30